jgi:hypothetical protein
MLHRSALLLVLAAVFAAATPAGAQREFFLSYSSLGIGFATRTNAIAIDRGNRTWFATDVGAAILIGDQTASFSPLTQSDFVGTTANVFDVDFGVLTDGENFFLGFVDRIEFGRALDDRVSISSLVLDVSEGLRSMASDELESLWVGTNDGLQEWVLGGDSPQLANRVFRPGDAIDPVEVAPWLTGPPDDQVRDPAVVLFSEDQSRLYLARATDVTATLLQNPNLSPVAGFDFESDDPDQLSDGDLWVGGTRAGSAQVIVRYPGQVLKGSNPGDAAPESFGFNVSLRTILDIAVQPVTGVIWVATDRGAYFQEPIDDSLSSQDCTNADETCRGWRLQDSTVTDRIDVVFADPSGNIWFGTDRGARGLLVRLLTLDSSRYLGDGATATASLEDLVAFAGNGQEDTATVDATVGNTTKPLTSMEEDDTGQFSFSFTFSTSTESDDTFLVSSGTEGVPVVVTYTFLDAVGNQRSLIATASWANIVDFDDDFFINGPCFLRTLSP